MEPLTPTSASTYGHPDYASPRLNGLHNTGLAQAYPSSPVLSEPPKKKQKRNKPTLSCEECVERKTKASQPIHTV
jgi:hypothetical protein